MNLITTSDCFAIFGARGMAGSAISRALERAGYFQQLQPSRAELDLLDPLAVHDWFAEYKPTVVVLAAAKVGGIHANASYPADFLLENLKIQTNVIETAWRSGVRRLLFLVVVVFIPNSPSSLLMRKRCSPDRSSPRMSGMRSRKLLESSSVNLFASSMALMPSA